MPKERVQAFIRKNPNGSTTFVKAFWREPNKLKGVISKPKGFKQSKTVSHGDR